MSSSGLKRLNRSVASLLAVLVSGTVCMPAAAQCQIQKITASDMTDSDQFGDGVALSGTLAVVGASRDDDLGSNAGSAYVLRYEEDPDNGSFSWVETVKLLASDGAANDVFGWSVDVDATAMDGEVIVVGAYLDDDAGSSAGAVYVFRNIGGEWIEEAKLVPETLGGGDEFGRSVAVSGDVIVAGAPRDDDQGTNAGAVYVFRFNGAMWLEEQKLTAFVPEAQDQLGASVDVDDDVLIAGSPLNDHAGISSGAADVFRYDGGEWLFEQRLLAPDANEGDRFGEAVAISGSIAAVGAPFDDEFGENAGAAYVYRYDGAWIDPAKLLPMESIAGDQFGVALEVADGPGDDDVLVAGAYLADDAGSASGAAYAYGFDGVDWIEQIRLTAADAAASAQFGWSVALDGEFILVGANKDDDDVAGVNVGAVYAFISPAGGIVDCNENGVHDGCEIAQGEALDCNGNGVPDECDIDDGTSEDVNTNGVPDECEDCNGNGIPDSVDIDEETSQDCNQNGIPDECDIDGGTSEDVNENGVPDECEDDCNGNGVADFEDILNGTSEDCNGNEVPDECDIDEGSAEDCNENGVPDACDVVDGTSDDCDENGVPDECQDDCNENGVADPCDIADGTSFDLNGNGVPDECEDCDGNGLPDFIDIQFDPGLDCNDNEVIDVCEIPADSQAPGGPFYCTEDCDPDCNINGIPDECDIAAGTSEDCDGNGVPDECDVDCNGNGVPDPCDIDEGTSEDVNGNGIPDECEDCNDNGTPDETDISNGTSDDCNANGIPDECEIAEDSQAPGGPFFCTEDCDPDCNSNGIPDQCDIDSGESSDFNGNGIPDQCEPDCNENDIADFLEILFGTADDCNENEIPDECDIADGTSADANGNGIPDECESEGDITGDGVVDVQDLLALLEGWGSCPAPPDPCPADVNGDGLVDVADLLVVLGNWS